MPFLGNKPKKFRNHLHRWLWTRKRRATALLQGISRRMQTHREYYKARPSETHDADCAVCEQINDELARAHGAWKEAQNAYTYACSLGFVIRWDEGQAAFVRADGWRR